MNKYPQFAYLTFPMSLIDSDAQIKALCTDAVLKGATPSYSGEDVIYPIEPSYISPDVANYCVSQGVLIEQYKITRYIAVSDLSESLPEALPQADGIVVWQDVQNLPTVNVGPINGVYYFNVTAHISHRGLSLDEYNSASSLPLLESPPTS